MAPIAETRLAVIEELHPGIILVRYRPGAVLDTPGIAEIMGVLDGLPAEVPCGVVVTIPEDADFDIGIMHVDHYRGLGLADRTRWLAVVAESGLFKHLTEIYFRYHPQGFPFKVFTARPEAVRWLEEQLEEQEAG